MTKEEIYEFWPQYDKITLFNLYSGLNKKIQLFGFTSTSTSKNLAISYAWENKTTGH